VTLARRQKVWVLKIGIALVLYLGSSSREASHSPSTDHPGVDWVVDEAALVLYFLSFLSAPAIEVVNVARYGGSKPWLSLIIVSGLE